MRACELSRSLCHLASPRRDLPANGSSAVSSRLFRPRHAPHRRGVGRHTTWRSTQPRRSQYLGPGRVVLARRRFEDARIEFVPARPRIDRVCPACSPEAVTMPQVPFQPFESLIGRLVCADTLVHTWDPPGQPARTSDSIRTQFRNPWRSSNPSTKPYAVQVALPSRSLRRGAPTSRRSF